jgi:DNA-binding MarR family transcriptional regulator
MKPGSNNSHEPRERAPSLKVIRDLALFRYQLRKFLRFSESAARNEGVTPLQHQLLLGVAGFNGKGHATISELAEFLQERHNSVVELVARAVQRGLVRKDHNVTDRRFVYVSLTPQGKVMLTNLSKLHRSEIERLRTGLLARQIASKTSRAVRQKR